MPGCIYTTVIDRCEPPCGLWVLNLCPLEGQPVLQTTEPPLQPQACQVFVVMAVQAETGPKFQSHRYWAPGDSSINPNPVDVHPGQIFSTVLRETLLRQLFTLQLTNWPAQTPQSLSQRVGLAEGQTSEGLSCHKPGTDHPNRKSHECKRNLVVSKGAWGSLRGQWSTVLLGQEVKELTRTSSKNSGTQALFSFLEPSQRCAKPHSMRSLGLRGLPGSSDYRCGGAEPDLGRQKREGQTHLESLERDLQQETPQGTGAQGSARASGGNEPRAAPGGGSRWPCQGRRHSPTISSTLRECVPQSPRTNSTRQQAGPQRCMAAPVRVSGSGSAPPRGHVHSRPRPRPAHSVSEIPADSAKAPSATSEDPEPQRPVGESGSG